MKYVIYNKTNGRGVGFGESPDNQLPDMSDPNLKTLSVQEEPPSEFKVVSGEIHALSDSDFLLERQQEAMVNLRHRRNQMIAACDWTQAPDAPTNKTAWADYRQKLRDLPNTTSDPFNPVWPVPPDEQ